MIEIIPNWHPIFVHFTVVFFSTAVGFYILSFLAARIPIFQTAAGHNHTNMDKDDHDH